MFLNQNYQIKPPLLEVSIGYTQGFRKRAYYMPENLASTPKIRWHGVRVHPK